MVTPSNSMNQLADTLRNELSKHDASPPKGNRWMCKCGLWFSISEDWYTHVANALCNIVKPLIQTPSETDKSAVETEILNLKKDVEYWKGRWEFCWELHEDHTIPCYKRILEVNNLKKLLTWALKQCTPTFEGQTDKGHNINLVDCTGCGSTGMNIPAHPIEHTPECPYAAALEAIK